MSSDKTVDDVGEKSADDSIVIVMDRKENPSTSDRSCWICFGTDEDSAHTEWVQPCMCNGSTKWVHHRCLHRWIDEKQKGNTLRAVSCQQCQTEYIIVFPQMGKFTKILERFDNYIKRCCPFVTAGIVITGIYWCAVTYGAVTFLQIVGLPEGLIAFSNNEMLILLIGLPAIPTLLIAGRFLRWEDAVIRIYRNRRVIMQKVPLMSALYPNLCGQEDDDNVDSQNPAAQQIFTDPISATRILCGALILPTISVFFGRVFFGSVSGGLQRAVLGGLTYITIKGILKIYLKQKRYIYRKQRRVIDYTPENIISYDSRGNASSANRQRALLRQIPAAALTAAAAAAPSPEPPVHERDMVV